MTTVHAHILDMATHQHTKMSTSVCSGHAQPGRGEHQHVLQLLTTQPQCMLPLLSTWLRHCAYTVGARTCATRPRRAPARTAVTRDTTTLYVRGRLSLGDGLRAMAVCHSEGAEVLGEPRATWQPQSVLVSIDQDSQGRNGGKAAALPPPIQRLYFFPHPTRNGEGA